MGAGRAFLWIPPNCQQVRAVVVGQHNMIEQGILEHPAFRKTLAELGIAEIWVAPPFDNVFRFDQGAGDQFNAMMKALAVASGYQELEFAPIVPLGHSACASYSWNFAAWKPDRTLAVLSVHGDAPLTNLTGSGRPNPDWGDRTIDGVPGLMVMGEYEWLEDRLTPALDFRNKHPQVPLAMLAEPGSGHFNYSDKLVDFLSMFIRKTAEQRLPAEMPLDRPPVLKPIDPSTGWLVERWHFNQGRIAPPAPAARYTGDPKQAFWCFDEEMAQATQDYSADQLGKLPQLLSITDGQMLVEKGCGEPVILSFMPMSDGITFQLKTAFMDAVPGDEKNKNPARWTELPPGSSVGHATGGGPIVISKIVGPVAQITPGTFAIRLDRNAETIDKRNGDIWLLASQPGDAKYKSAVQQALMRIRPNTEGADQQITFPGIPDQKVGTASIKLTATSDAHVPVSYYVREGPAEIDGDTLKFTPLPPRSKFPVAVTVVAWQWGRSNEPKLKTAQSVERTFYLTKPANSAAANERQDVLPVSIEIDATKTKGELHPIWRYFGADEPNYAYMKDGQKLLGELGQLSPGHVFFRAHNLLTSGDGTARMKWGSTNAYTEDAQGKPVYDWTLLDKIFDTYKEKGIRPYVQIGFMPKALSTHPEPYENHYGRGDLQGHDFLAGWSCPPKDYKKWGELVYQWARHCGERYGKDEAASWDWEVWNEPNGYWSGTPQEFFELYDYAVDGVRRALPKAKVGGAEFAGGPGGLWLKNFLDHCRNGTNAATGKTGAPLDFISFHAKGSPKFVDGHVQMGLAHELQDVDRAFGVIASFSEYKNLPIVVGEADPDGCAACTGPQLGYRPGTLYPSYTAACFARAYELADKHGVNLDGLLTWAFEFENKPYFDGYRVLATNGIDLPILNLFRMYSQMGGQRLEVRSTSGGQLGNILKDGVRGAPDVYALAGLEEKKLSVMVWNYHDDDVPGPDARVTIALSGLHAQGPVKVTEYRIDENHSNAFTAWKKMGSPPSPSPSPEQYAELQKRGQLEQAGTPYQINVDAGKMDLQLQLPRQAIALLILEWQ